MFCPFIKGACVSDCVFCNDDNTCNFINTIIKILAILFFLILYNCQITKLLQTTI